MQQLRIENNSEYGDIIAHTASKYFMVTSLIM